MDKQIEKPYLIDEYLPCSHAEIRAILREKRDSVLQNGQDRHIGELLFGPNIITEQGLNSVLAHQRVDRLMSCPAFSSLSQIVTLGKYFFELSLQVGQPFIVERENDPALYVFFSGKIKTAFLLIAMAAKNISSISVRFHLLTRWAISNVGLAHRRHALQHQPNYYRYLMKGWTAILSIHLGLRTLH